MVKARSWAISTLEQSRGSWLTETVDGVMPVEELRARALVADSRGAPVSPAQGDVTLLVGPEGDFDTEEVSGTMVGLGDQMLRGETAAVVGAALLQRKHHAEG